MSIDKLTWRRSSHSGAGGGNSNCVEIAVTGDAILIRDSKLATTGDFSTLAMSGEDWIILKHTVITVT